MIHVSRFLDLQLKNYENFKKAEIIFITYKEKLFNSTQGLIAHPEVSQDFKLYLLDFIKTLEKKCGT